MPPSIRPDGQRSRLFLPTAIQSICVSVVDQAVLDQVCIRRCSRGYVRPTSVLVFLSLVDDLPSRVRSILCPALCVRVSFPEVKGYNAPLG